MKNDSINNVRIINENGKFYVKINGNLTANATIAWYVNGKYSTRTLLPASMAFIAISLWR